MPPAAAPTATSPAAAAPSRPWWREAQSCGLRVFAWSSNRRGRRGRGRPGRRRAPTGSPARPRAAARRSAGSRCRYGPGSGRAGRPPNLSPISVPTVEPPTQYSRRIGWSPAYRIAPRHDLGLVDRRHRLRPRGSRDNTQPNCGVFTAGICTIVTCTLLLSCSSSARTRLGEPLDRVLRPAVRALQRDAAVGQRRADLHDRAPVPRQHPLQCGLGAVDVTRGRSPRWSA